MRVLGFGFGWSDDGGGASFEPLEGSRCRINLRNAGSWGYGHKYSN